MCCLYKKPCLCFIQFSHCDVLFRRPVLREWVAAFVVVMEVIYHRFGACVEFFNEGIIDVTRLIQQLEQQSHRSYNRLTSKYHTLSPYFFAK